MQPDAGLIRHNHMSPRSRYRTTMTRPLRLEFPGAVYHVTSRGDRMECIYRSDADRVLWLGILGDVARRFNFVVHSYCQMDNHYHLVVETADANLARGMRHLNGVYTQAFNRRYGLTGHLFQGRYHAILVQKESYLLELIRYVALNPLRAGMVAFAEDWRWSSHHFVAAGKPMPHWHNVDNLLRHFAPDSADALPAYRAFIRQGIGRASPLLQIRHQYVLGDPAFVARFQSDQGQAPAAELSMSHRKMNVLTLHAYTILYAARDEAMTMAYRTTAYTLAEISRHYGISTKTAGRAIRAFNARS